MKKIKEFIKTYRLEISIIIFGMGIVITGLLQVPCFFYAS